MAAARTKLAGSLLMTMMSLSAHIAVAAPPVHLDRRGEQWAASTLRKMTLEEKIGQLIMVWARVQFLNAHSPEYLQLREEMRTYHVGGFGVTVATDGPLLIKSQPLEAAYLTNSLQKDSKYPLIFAADFERGLAMRLTGATEFPAAMAFGAAGDPALAREFGRISAIEARAVGIQWNWFPVADVNSNPANPIINTRSFGEDPTLVSQMVAAYIHGAREAGLLTTAKHFPGHGDTDTDSHLALARVTASEDRLNSLELVPFRAAIAAGVDAVMVGHVTVPAIEPDPNRPASISSHVIQGLLQDKLGFHGLVVTDALDMQGLMRAFQGSEAAISGQEAVEAIRAGNDMVIIPADLDGAYTGLLQAVKHGDLTQKRIDESVLKILRMKASVGLNVSRYVTIDQVREAVASPESKVLGAKVADRAITLVKDDAKLLPLTPSSASPPVAVIFADEARADEGARAFAHELRARVSNAQIFYVDSSNADLVSDEVLSAVKRSSRVIAVAESVPGARRTTQGQQNGSVSLDVGPARLLTGIVQSAGEKTILAAFGNPYSGVGLAGLQTYVCTFSNAPGSATSLVRALFGEIGIHGRLPVTIPGVAARGEGHELAATSPSQP